MDAIHDVRVVFDVVCRHRLIHLALPSDECVAGRIFWRVVPYTLSLFSTSLLNGAYRSYTQSGFFFRGKLIDGVNYSLIEVTI